MYNFLAPLGLVSLKTAFIGWVVISQALIVISILVTLRFWSEPKSIHLLLPLLAAALLFRPTLGTLMDGQLGAILLTIIVLSMRWMRDGKAWLAGMMLGVLWVKPTIGAPLIFLVCLWSLRQQKYAAICGVFISTSALAIAGFVDDPAWIGKFLAIGNQKLSDVFGSTPTLWGFANLVCSSQATCTMLVAGISLVFLTALVGYLLIFNPFFKSFTAALCLIIPLTVMTTPYIWAYDQILLLLPVTVLTMALFERGVRYLLVAITPILFSILSLLLLVMAMNVGNDALSFLLPLTCMLSVFWLALSQRTEQGQMTNLSSSSL